MEVQDDWNVQDDMGQDDPMLLSHPNQHDAAADIIVGGDDEFDMDEDEDFLNPSASNQKMQRSNLLMKFCPHDSSMLYPKEHKQTRTLNYACRLCPYIESSSSNPLIYQNIIKKEVTNVLHNVPSSISDDPTLPRSTNISCTNCGHYEAVFFQSDSSGGQSLDSLALIFVCCNCDHKWIQETKKEDGKSSNE